MKKFLICLLAILVSAAIVFALTLGIMSIVHKQTIVDELLAWKECVCVFFRHVKVWIEGGKA